MKSSVASSTMPMMRLPPGEPTIMTRSPDSTKVGVIEESMRLAGAMALASAPTRPKPLGASGLIEKSSISLLRNRPVPAIMRPQPKRKFSVMVAATRLPSRSSTEKCVVCGPALAPAPMPGQRAAGRRVVGADRGGEAGGIVGAGQARHGHADEIRIAEVHGAVAMRAAHGLDDQVLALQRLSLAAGRIARAC